MNGVTYVGMKVVHGELSFQPISAHTFSNVCFVAVTAFTVNWKQKNEVKHRSLLKYMSMNTIQPFFIFAIESKHTHTRKWVNSFESKQNYANQRMKQFFNFICANERGCLTRCICIFFFFFFLLSGLLNWLLASYILATLKHVW